MRVSFANMGDSGLLGGNLRRCYRLAAGLAWRSAAGSAIIPRFPAFLARTGELQAPPGSRARWSQHVMQYIYTMIGVSKVVPPKREIIKDISLSFFPGAKIGLLG